MRILRIVFFVFLACSVLIAQVAPQNSSDCKLPLPVGLAPIGTPLWKPVDFHVFTAAVGTPDDNFAEFGQNQTNLLYPLRHQSCTELGIGPGAAHQPPYRQEMEAGMDIMNFRDSLDFFKKDFTTPNGVWAVWMVVPSPGTTGSSPDFTSGPIIPNSVFPIQVTGATYRNHQLWDPYLASFSVPPLTAALSCPFAVDGHSHFPVFLADTSAFGPGGPIDGKYQFRVTMLDVTNNGWSITVTFTVK